MVKRYKLTIKGLEECGRYLKELEAKRKEILDAGIDTADDTTLPSINEMFIDTLSFGIDDDGEIYNAFGVTDNISADRPLWLKLGYHFVEMA